ncbi:MAG TPA: zinc ribbon domain-containing protein, partial [Longimicrobiaceae bacterium]|nr:zinc ribbon domain-containing protein [Longimicrobiaceae bacterium]
ASTGAGAAPVDAALESPPAPPALPRASGPAEAPPAPVPPALCRACHAPLPDAPDLRFCPACGAGQGEQPCAKCGAALRPEWRFCIHCGERRGR